MANRNTLARTKIEQFKLYISEIGYQVLDPKGGFEVMRFKIPNNPMGIIFNGKSPVHYSANHAAYPFVKGFINGNHKNIKVLSYEKISQE